MLITDVTITVVIIITSIIIVIIIIIIIIIIRSVGSRPLITDVTAAALASRISLIRRGCDPITVADHSGVS